MIEVGICPLWEKPSPGGWCSAQRIRNLYDCRWQSYLYYGGPAQAGPDEVEGHSVVPTYGDDWQLQPHQSQLTLRQLPLQGKPSLRSTGPVFLVGARHASMRRRSTGQSPFLLGEGAPKGPGVEGNRYHFRIARIYDRPHIRHAKRRDTFSPGRRLTLRRFGV